MSTNTCAIRAYFLFTGSGPIVIITSFDSIQNKPLIDKLAAKGINKFIAYEIPLETAQKKYGKHYEVVCGDIHEENDLRVLDFNGERAFANLSFKEMGTPIFYEAKK